MLLLEIVEGLFLPIQCRLSLDMANSFCQLLFELLTIVLPTGIVNLAAYLHDCVLARGVTFPCRVPAPAVDCLDNA